MLTLSFDYEPVHSELESKKWRELRVNRAGKNNRRGLELSSNSSFNFRHLGKECAEISYFDIDLKNNTMVLWTDNFAGISWENGVKAVYNLQNYWTSMAAILASLFSQAEWLKFLLQIYMEVTACS